MKINDRSTAALRRAIKIAGSQVALAKAIGTQQQNVSYWLRIGRPSAEAAVAIDEVTGITRKQLRPDLYDGSSSKRTRMSIKSRPRQTNSEATRMVQENKLDQSATGRCNGKQKQSKDSRPRCGKCLILLFDGQPPSACMRYGCRFYTAPYSESPTVLQSSLNGTDYSEVP